MYWVAGAPNNLCKDTQSPSWSTQVHHNCRLQLLLHCHWKEIQSTVFDIMYNHALNNMRGPACNCNIFLSTRWYFVMQMSLATTLYIIILSYNYNIVWSWYIIVQSSHHKVNFCYWCTTITVVPTKIPIASNPNTHSMCVCVKVARSCSPGLARALCTTQG